MARTKKLMKNLNELDALADVYVAKYNYDKTQAQIAKDAFVAGFLKAQGALWED